MVDFVPTEMIHCSKAHVVTPLISQGLATLGLIFESYDHILLYNITHNASQWP